MNQCGELMESMRGRTWVRHVDSVIKLVASISPCVFLYDQYPLQLEVTLRRNDEESLGSALAVERAKTQRNSTDADIRRILDAVGLVACRRCSAPAFDPTTVRTNRAGLCESCFLDDLRRESRRAEDAERKAIAARDRRMKRSGHAVRVTAWVHPVQGGDDYQVDWYFETRPTHAQIRRLLHEMRSRVCDDYQIIAL